MMSDQEFARLAGEALDELPDRIMHYVRNVAIVYADEPTPEQRERLRLRGDQTLLGLYEGIPQIKRDAGYNMVLPDKITIFKLPLLARSPNSEVLKKNVKHTLWHEIAHHFGLDHDRIDQIQRKGER